MPLTEETRRERGVRPPAAARPCSTECSDSALCSRAVAIDSSRARPTSSSSIWASEACTRCSSAETASEEATAASSILAAASSRRASDMERCSASSSRCCSTDDSTVIASAASCSELASADFCAPF